ncbi:MAG TPA: Crp/Fnr family transcriptional regulator [Flavobacterium sp.]|nr:Crp/Fnr family transcriptional regulator [Flavobacterium sp.]
MELDLIFQNISRIVSLSEEDKAIFSSIAEVVAIKKKELLLSEGQVCRYDYFVLGGCMRSFYIDENLIEHTMMFAVEGWWTGNLKSFVKGLPSEFYLEAIEDTRLLRLRQANLEKLYASVPKFERYFRILLQNRLIATQDRVSSHLSVKASEKYEQFCKKHPALEQRVPLKYIASYLGITPTYLSRIRKKRTGR